ncbi:sensor histidine kinase [Microbacterium sp. A84]|uniref:sensor histidine kinase n=1 Tax=Microbacterium sp. A84 TaxID=3450715 RepID=UPI003F436BC4
MTSRSSSARRRRWSDIWRWAAAAAIGMLVFVVGYGVELETVDPDGQDAAAIGVRMLIDLGLGVVVLGLYAFRRRAPRLIPAVAIALTAFSWLGAGAAAALLVFVSARRRPREIAVAAALYTAVNCIDITVHPFDDGTPLWLLLVIGGILTGALVLLGLLIGARRQLDEAADAAHTAQIERAGAQERSRIAREMHDVLGHRLSLIAVHAGALEYRRDLSPQQAAEAAGVIRENSHLALDELRDVLGVLRGEGHGDTESSPQPIAADIHTLIADARAAGNTIIISALDTDGIPAALGRHLFRIVQEMLTNARKHAQGERIFLHLTSDAVSGVRLSAQNRVCAPVAPPGFGLTGVAERARLAGGELLIDEADGLFRVEVVLPWPN